MLLLPTSIVDPEWLGPDKDSAFPYISDPGPTLKNYLWDQVNVPVTEKF
jgi:hypothetical protein